MFAGQVSQVRYTYVEAFFTSIIIGLGSAPVIHVVECHSEAKWKRVKPPYIISFHSSQLEVNLNCYEANCNLSKIMCRSTFAKA